ncbi:MarR family winged helix-turn-helix transcriptional regulator [Nocardioides sp. YIM 152588]|uniref:MarR family winged helix-turn-helix transcriptional regulator n=1 Tax=Nocardioides sp. YIM 152588 TaxID=3158259 RepID=UPI0032E504EE
MDAPTDPREPEDVDALVGALLTASRALVGVSARSLAGVEDHVTLAQFRTLVVLQGHGPTRLSLLAERLGVGPSTAVRAVDRLVAAGYADRRASDRDRREVVIEASAAGTDLVRAVTARRRAAIERIVRAMPPTGREELVAALTAFADAAGEPDAPSPESASLLGW